MRLDFDTETIGLLILLTLILTSLYQTVARLLRAYFVRRFTTLEDLPLLGVPRADGERVKGTAVICGGSISGLLAARVCADHFTDVLIIDPELNEVERAKPSTRIAQYDSLHGYLAIVYDGLCRLWPSFADEVVKAGGHIAPADVKPYFSGTLLPAPHAHYASLGQSLPRTMYIRRPQFENVLRKLVLGPGSGCRNVRAAVGTVRGLDIVTGEGSEARVKDVLVRTTDGTEAVVKDPALVVDCTGDTQAGFKWLKKVGYTFPSDARLEYDQKLHYVTITFSVPRDVQERLPIPPEESSKDGRESKGNYDDAGWLYTYVPHPAVSSAGFVLGRMDNDTIQLCCGAWGPASLPTTPAEILPFVQSIPTSSSRSLSAIPPNGSNSEMPAWLLDTLRLLVDECGEDASVKSLRIRPCSNIRYHLCHDTATGIHLPSNFVALGDSMLQLNPIYAQGCSKALMGATTLNALLHRYNSNAHPHPSATLPLFSFPAWKRKGHSDQRTLPRSFAKEYFKEVGRHGQALWDSTKTFDYGFDTTRPVPGEALTRGALARWYLDRFIEASFSDTTLASTLWQVRMLLAPPTDMLAPSALWRVVWAGLRGRWHGLVVRGVA